MSEIIQVSLRGSRREFFLNSRNLWLRLRDRVVVQGEHGETLATVILKDPTLVALKRPGNVAREIIRNAVGNVFTGYFAAADLGPITDWFDLGGMLQVDDTLDAGELLARTAQVQGLRDLTAHAGIGTSPDAPLLAAAVDFILEGLYAQKKISRSDEFQYQGAETPRRQPRSTAPPEPSAEREMPLPGNKKKYYN